MGLMPIIFTALSIFVAATVIILIVSYVMYKLRPKQKPYIEIKAEKAPAEIRKPYYSVPVYEHPVHKAPQKQPAKQRIRYNNVNRFEVLNQQKPRYMQTNETRTFAATREIAAEKNIFEYYSDGFEGGFKTVTL